MQQAFAAYFQPSRQWQLIAAVLHGAAVLAVLWYVVGWLQWLWLALLLLSAAWTQWQLGGYGRFVAAVHIDAQGRAAICFRQDDIAQAAVLQDDSRIQRDGIWLHWRVAGRSLWQFVWADMTDAEAFRRLKVWACWCRTPPSAKQDLPPPAAP